MRVTYSPCLLPDPGTPDLNISASPRTLMNQGFESLLLQGSLKFRTEGITQSYHSFDCRCLKGCHWTSRTSLSSYKMASLCQCLSKSCSSILSPSLTYFAVSISILGRTWPLLGSISISDKTMAGYTAGQRSVTISTASMLRSVFSWSEECRQMGDWHQEGEVIRCGGGQLEGGEANVIHVGGYPTRVLRTEPGTSESEARAALCLSHLFYSSQLLIFDFLRFYRQQVQWYSGQFTVVNK